ncbi:MAG: hypothetical protein LBT49_07240, partial [Prevotellaceae bacterium]|nr:hypothetical protein [Prevotellaceae bacterium]
MKNIFKNQKNRIYNFAIVLVSIISLGFFMQSCSHEDDIFSDTIAVDTQQANLIASEYLELIGEQYVLNLSEEDAIALGISKFDYNRMQTEIEQTNLEIEQCMKNTNNRIQLIDSKSLNDIREKEIGSNILRLKNGTENSSNGYGSLYDQNWATFSIYFPSGYSRIYFNIYSQGIIGLGHVQVRDSYGVFDSCTSVQIFGYSFGCTVGLPYGGRTYTVQIRV